MSLLESEVHLFILWQRALGERQRILDDIAKKFTVLKVEDIKWDLDSFSQNLTRFYGEKLPSGSHKELECGTGRFTLVIVKDVAPSYAERMTSRGYELVNINMFDAKALYRSWTGGGHKIHSTNSVQETRHDIHLLTGKSYEYFCSLESGSLTSTAVDRNILGCVQWNSLSELFAVLNENVEYVVLRNFSGLPEHLDLDVHGDIDILVSSYGNAVHLLNAAPVYSDRRRVHFRVNVANKVIRFDIRHLGDDYYDLPWQRAILDTRVFQEGIYIPSPEQHKFSLLYHALIHKKAVHADYRAFLLTLGFDPVSYERDLLGFMSKHGYVFREPHDVSVFYKPLGSGHSITLRRRQYFWVADALVFLKRKIPQKFARRVKSVLRRFI